MAVAALLGAAPHAEFIRAAIESRARRGAKLESVGRADLCVTKGTIRELPGKRLSVEVPKMRAVVLGTTSQQIEARFTYLGPTTGSAPLGSGEIRRQFGLKLRAQDGCNVVYAMWRIEPEAKLVVSVKSNPGMRTHAECGTRGYQNIKPARATPVPALKPGDSHVLRAEMEGAALLVEVDGAVVWQGEVGAAALSFDGPVGLRSDNARFEIELAALPPHGTRTATPPCHEEEDSE